MSLASDGITACPENLCAVSNRAGESWETTYTCHEQPESQTKLADACIL